MSATTDDPLVRRAADWSDDTDLGSLTHARISEIASSHGSDFAVALLYQRMRCASRHAATIRDIERRTRGPAARSRFRIGIVPGAFHREPMGTGANGRRLVSLLERCGCRAEIIGTDSFGSIAGNARIICQWLRAADQDTVLVCLSKGAAEAKVALASPDGLDAFSRVRCWLNVSGILNGTPLVQWLSTQRFRSAAIRFYFGVRGYDFGVLDEMRFGPATLLDFDPPIPPAMQVVHLIGFPRLADLSSPMARRQHRRLLPLGPSDGGGILLADACRFPGTVYPVWGADHYLRPSWDIAPLIGRLVDHARG